LILRVLETLESPPSTQPSGDEEQTIEQLLTSLPTSIREALAKGDEAAFRQAFEELTPEDQQRVAAVLQRLQSRQDEGEEEQAVPTDTASFVSQFEPLLQAIAAVANGDASSREEVEEVLTELEAKGWHLKEAVQRLWAGGRDVKVLTEGLDEQDAALVV